MNFEKNEMKAGTYKVRGPVTVKFPLIMLHHDRAHPATVSDAKKIEQMLAEAPSNLLPQASFLVEIELVIASQGSPDRDLWRRFGWTVL